jgi:hypothetical protein
MGVDATTVKELFLKMYKKIQKTILDIHLNILCSLTKFHE